MSELLNESISDNTIAESWLSNLPPELQKTESLTKFKDVAALANSYLEAEKGLSSRVSIPKGDASTEEWQKFYSRLGLPQDKRYTDKQTKENEEYLTKYEEMFFNNGLSKRQGKKMLEELYNFSDSLQKKQEEETQTSHKSNEDELTSYYSDKV